MEIFWQTIAHYNSWSWIYQLIIVGIGILLSVLLFYRPRTWVKNSMKCYLAGVYLWLSIAYYYFDCGTRAYNEVMALIWALLALVWIWDLKVGYTSFNRTRKYDKLAYLLLAMPFVYPVISLLRGLTFPMITSPVMPCSVVVFTLGIMLLFSEKINLFLILCLTHWSVIGLTKTYYFNIPEDFLLSSASVPALYCFFKEYYANYTHQETKPSRQTVKNLLILFCSGIGLILLVTLVKTVFIHSV